MYGAFAIGARNFGWFRIAAGLSATFIGGASVINLAGLGYSFGWYGLTDVIATSTALLISAGIIVPLLFKRRTISLGGYLRGSGKSINVTTGLLTTVVYTLITAAQIVALIRLAQPYFPIPNWLFALIAITGVTAYVLYGGYSSVTVTDVIQFMVMTVFYFGLVGATLLIGSSVQEGEPLVTEAMPLDMVLLLALPLLFVPISQDVHIRINSASSQRDAKIGVGLAGLFYFLFCFISVSVGVSMAASGVELQSPDDVVPHFLSNHFGALSVIPTIAIIAAVISTLDSVLFASASSLAYDFWDLLIDKQRQKDSGRPQVSTLIVVGIALVIALQAQKILGLILSALVIYVSVLLPMVIRRALKKAGNMLGILAFATLAVVTILEAVGYVTAYRAFIYSAVHLTLVLFLPREQSS